MWGIKPEIIAAAELTGIPIIEISPTMMELVKDKSRKKFGWEDLDISEQIDHYAMMDSNAWRWLPEHFQHEPIIMYFREDEENVGYLFNDGSQITPVIGECNSFEFWLINLGYDYQIRFRDDDIVVGKGIAAEWIRKKAKELKELEDN